MVEFLGFSVSIYAIIMLVSFIFLLAVLALGGIADFFDFGGADTDVDTGLSPVSLPVIGVFGTAFGGFGTLFEGLDLGGILTPVLAAVLATATAGGVWAVMLKVFVRTQAETRVDLDTLVGHKGQVIIPVKPGQPGQIVVITDARGRVPLQAISDESIGTDEHVVIESVVASSVKVRRL